jgi:fibronectin-binding autotransporter adhesin
MSAITPGATNVVNFDVNAPAGTITFTGTNTFLGSVTVDAGTLNATTDSALGSSTAATAGLFMTPSAGTATVNFTSSTPAIASLSSSGAGTSSVVLGGTTTPTTLTVGGNNASTTFAGVISDKTGTNAAAIGSLTKTGNGTLTLTNGNTYTGATTVNAGTLLVNNTTGSGTGSGAVTVNNTGTLGGTGIIIAGANNVTVNSGGTITGATNGSVGTLTLTANTLVIGGTYLNDIDGATADRITLSGNLDLSSASDTLNFNQINAPTAPSYTLLSYSGTLSGTFDNVLNLPAGYAVQYNTGEIDLVAVPEPSTWIGAALALAAIGFTQRKRLRGLISSRA